MKKGAPRKADCSPGEWAEYLKKVAAYRQKNRDAYLARETEYRTRPENIAKRRAAYSTPEAKASKAAYRRSEHAKALAKARYERRKEDQAFMDSRNATSRRIRTGFTREMVELLKGHQGNKCAICDRSFESSRMCADHCHDTNRPRGLLCHECNVIEGAIRKLGFRPGSYFEKLAHYLDSPPASLLGLDQASLRT